MPNLTWITKKYFPQLSPRLINSGNCYNWALIAHQNYNNVKLFTVDDFGGHAFVKIGQNYFDAQDSLGVPHWTWLEMLRDMCRHRVYNILPWKQSLPEFLDYWRRNGKHSIISVSEDVYNRRNW